MGSDARTERKRTTVADSSVPERLLRAATELFAERGFESTSVQDIVHAAGVTKGAMYHYYSAKDDLLFEIYARVLRKQMVRLEKFAAEERPVEERVHTASADVVATTIESLQDFAIFVRSMNQLAADKQREVRRERRRYHEKFRAMIEEGNRTGAFRSDVEPDLVVHFFFGSVHHLPVWYTPRGRLPASEIGSSFAALLLAGLAPGG